MTHLLLASALGLALAAAGARAQVPPADTTMGGVRVASGLVPGTVTVGESFRSLVQVSVPAGSRVVFPELAVTDSLQPVVPVQVTGGRAVYTLVAWTAPGPDGAHISVRVVGPDGTERTLRVALPLPVVRSVLPEDTAGVRPMPARGIAAAPLAGVPWWVWVLLGLMAAGVAWALWRGRSHLRSRGRRVAAPSARAEALARLGELGEASAGAGPRFLHEEVSAILRRYLARLSPAWGPELTTRELAAALRRGGAPRAGADRLERLLGDADAVKFARHQPDAAAASAYLAAARGWVESFVEPAPEREAAA